MKDYVIGYEGRSHHPLPLVWGAAAVRNERGVFNAVFGDGDGAIVDTYERWQRKYAGGVCQELEVPVEVTSKGPFYVVDLRLDLLDRPPYSLDSAHDWAKKVYGIVAIGRGTTRGYYIFESHAMLERWLYHLHAEAFELVPARVLP